jgi:hypothetical protein
MTCPLCSSTLAAAAVITERARDGHRARRVVCSTCGLVQVSPRPSELPPWSDEPIRLQSHDVLPGTPEHAALSNALADQSDARILAAWGTLLNIANLSGTEADVVARCNASMADREVLPERAVIIDSLQRWADPVGTLRRIRDLRVKAVYVEVPDVDAYHGDRDGYHFRRERLYDFSDATLIGVLQSAGFGGVHVVAQDGKLIAWTLPNASAWVCDDPIVRAARLTSAPIETVPPAEVTAIDRFLSGDDVDMAVLRAELTALRGPYAAMLAAWDDAHRTLGSLQDAWSRAMRAHVEASVTDAWLAGASFGKGVAYDQAAKAVSHVLHRMGRLSGAYR